MSRHRVLITDYPWPDLDIERQILDDADAVLVAAPSADEPTLVRWASDADAILTCWAQVTATVLAAARRCRIVSRMGIGLDNIDVAECTRRGIPVTNVPDYCTVEVAEHSLALLLALARHLPQFHLDSKAGRYDLRSQPPPRRIAGSTLGIIGWGRIGQCLAGKAAALGLRIVAFTRNPRPAPGVEFVGLDALLGQADYVSLHLPLTPATRAMIGWEQLRRMKPTAVLINTARGGLVDHAALAAALRGGYLAGAGLDVQDPEPPDLTQPPYMDPRVLVTPHAAFVSVESLSELRTRATRNVAVLLAGGQPQHVVNPVNG